MPEVVIGIDLGTTFSVVAYVDHDGRPRLVENAEGRSLTPSIVLVEGGKVVVGELAANQVILKHDKVVRWIKRSMGDDGYRFEGLSPVEISAEILRKLKRDAEAALHEELGKAVITCPAYFAAPEVENTRKAGELAGFQVLEIVREPVAAAVYYGVDHLKEGEKILVYDLGGGTFDATVLGLVGGSFSPLPGATLGDRQLGGHDWTSDLLDYVAQVFAGLFKQDPRDDPVVHQALYERCEVAKCDLAKLERVTIACSFAGRTEKTVVERSTFEDLTRNRVQKTIQCCQQALAKAMPPLSWQQIDKVLLVGGSTRLRQVPEALARVSGKTPIRVQEVDTMVALGAAILAKGAVRRRSSAIALTASPSGDELSPSGTGLIEVKFDRTCARNLGTRVIACEDGSPTIRNSAIIRYGTLIPAEKVRDDYVTAVRNQSSFDVPIVEFDEVGEDVIVGTYRFRCRPRTPAKSRIAVTFKYDRSGIIEVEARDVLSGEVLPKEKVPYVEPDLAASPAVAAADAGADLDLLFMFDTTGSMYSCLEQVRTHLISIVQQIHRELPDTRIAIMAFGDHCDEATTYLVTKSLFTTATDELVSFIKTVGMTGGGDTPEAIEDALWEAGQMDWSQAAGKALVLVGDAPPHSVAECPHGRDYESEAAALKEAGVQIYSVLCHDGGGAESVFRWFAEMSGGKFLLLNQIEDLCDLLVAVAMKMGGKLDGFRSRLMAEDRLTESKSRLLEELGL